MGAKHWTENELNWLKENYPVLGADRCKEYLNRPVIKMVGRLKLKLLKRNYTYKPRDNYKIDHRLFSNIQTPQIAYLLGFMWADCNVLNSKTYFRISLEILQDDANQISEIINSCGEWNVYTRTRPNRRPQTSYITGQKPLHSILVNYGFLNKENCHDTVLDHIPENLKHYFWRGLFDGDGCIYINKKNYCYQLCFASCYDQDWSSLAKVLTDLNIKFSIRKQIGKTGNKSSQLRITNKSKIIKFSDYMLYGYQFGLTRKHEKLKSLSNYC